MAYYTLRDQIIILLVSEPNFFFFFPSGGLYSIKITPLQMHPVEKVHPLPVSILDGHYERAIMYFHTSLRNIGLYSSISLATLVCSYQFIKSLSVVKDSHQSVYKMVSLLLLLTSVGFLSVSVLLVRGLSVNIREELQHKYGASHTQPWLNILHCITACHVVMYVVLASILYLHFLK